jgi:hypothetical protein
MRKAINDNPMVQIGLICALLLLVGVMLVPQFAKQKDSGSSGSPNTSAISAQASGPGGTANPNVGVTPSISAPSTSSAPSTGSLATGSVPPEAFIPGPGLPRPVVSAWRRGNAVVLLVVRPAAVDDRLVRDSVDSLSARSGVAVFAVRANRIARYSRITQGLGVDRVPALVVVRPKRLSGSVPQAQVSYGFRNSQSVVQAVQDALYAGKDDLPYSPR